MQLPKFVLVNVFGWKIIGDFPDFKKSILIFAPHTSYMMVCSGNSI
jgi:hypothetical protein